MGQVCAYNTVADETDFQSRIVFMKIVFMGSPEFSVPSLEALVEARFNVSLVVTQPDRQKGRGQKVVETPVKTYARQVKVPVIEWGRDNKRQVVQHVLDEKPDAIVVVAFGHILRRELLDAPKYGCINVHASLLPRWRGVSPVHYSILHGDNWTGVTIMKMDAGVDTGPMLSQHSVAIDPEETSGDLLTRLAGVGADKLVMTLRDLENEKIEAEAQGQVGAVYAPKLNRSLSPIRWGREVVYVHNQIRGLQPWPGATTFLNGKQLKIISARPYSFDTQDVQPGTVIAADENGIRVGCGEGVLLITVLQNPGKRPMTAAEYLRGYKVEPGTLLTS